MNLLFRVRKSKSRSLLSVLGKQLHFKPAFLMHKHRRISRRCLAYERNSVAFVSVLLCSIKLLFVRCYDLKFKNNVDNRLTVGGVDRDSGKSEDVVAPSEFLPEETEKVLRARLRAEKSVVLYLIDAVDFNGTSLDLTRIIGTRNPVILGINKCDLLPKGFSTTRLKKWMQTEAKKSGLEKIYDIHILSSLKGYGVKEMLNQAYKLAKYGKCNIYVVGAANVGKSSFINDILRTAWSRTSKPKDRTLTPPKKTNLRDHRSKREKTSSSAFCFPFRCCCKHLYLCMRHQPPAPNSPIPRSQSRNSSQRRASSPAQPSASFQYQHRMECIYTIRQESSSLATSPQGSHPPSSGKDTPTKNTAGKATPDTRSHLIVGRCQSPTTAVSPSPPGRFSRDLFGLIQSIYCQEGFEGQRGMRKKDTFCCSSAIGIGVGASLCLWFCLFFFFPWRCRAVLPSSKLETFGFRFEAGSSLLFGGLARIDYQVGPAVLGNWFCSDGVKVRLRLLSLFFFLFEFWGFSSVLQLVVDLCL